MSNSTTDRSSKERQFQRIDNFWSTQQQQLLAASSDSDYATGSDDICRNSSGASAASGDCNNKQYLLVREATISQWQHQQLKQQWFSNGAVRGYSDCDNDQFIFLFERATIN